MFHIFIRSKILSQSLNVSSIIIKFSIGYKIMDTSIAWVDIYFRKRFMVGYTNLPTIL